MFGKAWIEKSSFHKPGIVRSRVLALSLSFSPPPPHCHFLPSALEALGCRHCTFAPGVAFGQEQQIASLRLDLPSLNIFLLYFNPLPFLRGRHPISAFSAGFIGTTRGQTDNEKGSQSRLQTSQYRKRSPSLHLSRDPDRASPQHISHAPWRPCRAPNPGPSRPSKLFLKQPLPNPQVWPQSCYTKL